MTGKELMYLEDALGHARYLQRKYGETAAQLQDPALRGQVLELARRRERTSADFLALL